MRKMKLFFTSALLLGLGGVGLAQPGPTLKKITAFDLTSRKSKSPFLRMEVAGACNAPWPIPVVIVGMGHTKGREVASRDFRRSGKSNVQWLSDPARITGSSMAVFSPGTHPTHED